MGPEDLLFQQLLLSPWISLVSAYKVALYCFTVVLRVSFESLLNRNFLAEGKGFKPSSIYNNFWVFLIFNIFIGV